MSAWLIAPGLLFVALVARALARRGEAQDGKASEGEERPKKAPPPPMPPTAPPIPTSPRYVTAPADVVPPAAWARVGDVEVSAEPLRDRKTGGYAHLTYRGALEAAKRIGGELPSRQDVIALSDAARAKGLELDPVTLPDAAMVREAGGAPNDQAVAQRLRTANMTGEPWARLHDERVAKQLRARGWDGRDPIANAGKLWIRGAPPGRAYLMGWRRRDGSWIQSGTSDGPGPHDDLHHDYATLTIVKRAARA